MMDVLRTFTDQKNIIGAEFTDFVSYLHNKDCDGSTLEQLESLYPKWLKSKKKGQFNRIYHDRRKRESRL